MAETEPHQQSSLTARAAWLTVAKTVGFACTVVLPLLLVRRLDQREFGFYKQFFLVVGTLVSALPLGFGMSAFYFLPREAERRSQVILNITLFNTAVGLLALVVLALRPALLAAVFNSGEMATLAPLIGLVVLLWIVASFLELAAVANHETKLASAFIVASQLSRTLLLLAAAFFSPSVRALAWAAVAHGLLQAAALVAYLRSRFGSFWRGFDREIFRAQLAYALPLGAAGLLFALQADLHNYFVSHRFDAATYAVYSIGCFQLPLVMILSESISTVMIPQVSRLQKEGDHREIVALTARAARKLAAVFFPLYAFLLVAGREFLTVLFTSQYAASWPVFAINLTLLPFNVLGLDALQRAFAGERYYVLRVRVALFVVSLGALWFATVRFGLVGSITAVVALNLFERLLIALRFGRLLGVGRADVRLLRDTGKLAAAALAAGLAAFAARALAAGLPPLAVLVLCAAVFAVVYLGAVVALGVPTPEERAQARGLAGRLQKFVPGRRAADSLT